MKTIIYTVIAIMSCITIASCDDTTDSIGNSLTDNMDMLKVTTDTFNVATRSIVADSVLSRSTTGYLGKIRDIETGNYITGDFMAQFSTLENYKLPEKDSIVSLQDGEVIADSCSIRLFYTDYYGDSLATMNITAYEMNEPMKEGVKYYSNFDPIAEGLIRNDGMKVNKTYTLTDLSISDEDRADESSYTPNIKINLNKPYTDKNGVTYNNYGTYIMRMYYEDPDRFKNSYNFIHEVCPGFYFKTNDGIGSMAYITVSQLNIYFRYLNDSTYVGTTSFSATEEVLQTTNISNDKQNIADLANDNTCTYLKTPAGIFTEITLPVDEITENHSNDTINTAKISLTRINNNTHDEYSLSAPSTLLMIPKDSLYTFFENGDNVDYKKSFIATYSSSTNQYTFNNISGMITYMADIKKKGLAENSNWLNEHPDWNRVVVIPVSVTTNSSSQIVKIVHDMSLTSTKLVGGSENPYEPIKINVIYSKFNHE
ncbi:DUF4270 domain-containing protein [Xylanibacter rarus]|jgi:hypothetical protein|uniref:DUF4270 domain-containing protein n=1 Tax=Xylanibacter rarus TaxID=1676614 RepID=A0A8E1UQD8_9BACT|nr:DUF4270 domain-containing protein [Xylanibacter rarus]KOO68346.1 hypothetical protein ACU52_08215 [Xylanibacter rarus]